MAISLGRECSLTWDGVAVPGVRDVTVDVTPETTRIRPFGSRAHVSVQTGYAIEMVVETIDDAAATTAVSKAQSGGEIAVVATGWSFTAVVAGVTDGQPLDDLRTFRVVLHSTQQGLRS